MRLLRWLKNLMIGQGLRWKVNNLSVRLSRLDKRRTKNRRELSVRRSELDVIKDALAIAEDRLRETVDEALRIQKQHEEQLDSALAKVRVYETATVPCLMEQNQMLLKFWEAESAIQVRRQVGFQIDKPDME